MTSADDAAVLIQSMRDNPDLLKTELGHQAHRAALKKIKGTPWEKVLFERPTAVETERMLKSFRKHCQRIEKVDALTDEALEERKQKSIAYLESRRREKETQDEPDGAA